MPTVLAFERHPVHPARISEFEALLAELVGELRTQPGLLWADAGQALDDTPSYLLASEWRTPADLDGWEASAAFRSFCEREDPWLREAPTRRRFHAS